MCTSFRIAAGDGSVVVGRTMEYTFVLNYDLVAVPRALGGTSLLPGGVGVSWKGDMGYVGIAVGETSLFGQVVPASETVVDGVNEAGLYAGLLYLPGFTEYQPADGVPLCSQLNPMDMASFVLASCRDVAEARQAMEAVTVVAGPAPVIGVPPLHLVLHDRSGRSAVVEYVGGERRIHDNPLGVVTNGPTFDWHLAHMRQFISLSSDDPEPAVFGGQSFTQIGQGNGLFGLPGDYTPPSRFVRAAILSSLAEQAPDSAGAVVTALHLLNSIDIVRGAVISANPEGVKTAARMGDFTGFSSVVELGANPAYTLRTYQDPVPRRLELSAARLDGPAPVRRSINEPGAPLPLVM